MSDLSSQAQTISDQFHHGVNSLDQLRADTSQLDALMAEFRVDAGMGGISTQRTVDRMRKAQTALAEARAALTSAHESARKDIERERADIIWDCPDWMKKLGQTTLRAVG